MKPILPYALPQRFDIWILGGLICISLWLAILFNTFIPALLPIGIYAGYALLQKPEWAFLLLGISIPISTEITLPGNLGTDFPSEQLMWVSFVLGGLTFISRLNKIDLRPILHPASLLLIASFTWLWVCVITSEFPMISLKYALAKTWYIGVFYFMGIYLFRNRPFFDKWIGLLCVTVLVSMFIVILRHSQSSFNFEDVNRYLNPFYRNHVAYACMLGVSFPWLFYLVKNTGKKRLKFVLYSAIIILILAIYFSYTRAAILALGGALAWIFVMKYNFSKIALAVSIVVVSLTVGFFIRKDKYLEFAPDYYKTISHKNFDQLLSATYKLEDISSMERVYRWVSGYYMIREKPLFGFGPSTFYESYRPYTVNSFKTYVSDNPEKSGIHNYYLMIATEQGIPGILIWLVFCFYLLILAQKLYNTSKNQKERALILSSVMTIVFVLIICSLNDMIETDKVGPLFYVSAALIVGIAVQKKIL